MNDDAVTSNQGQITIERRHDARIVSFHGEHDVATVPHIGERLADARIGDGVIVVDLTEATFIDSSVMGALFHAYRADIPPRLRFVAPADTAPRRLFDFVGFAEVVPIFERPGDALADSTLT
jgi:anti-sigma B factor antagonist